MTRKAKDKYNSYSLSPEYDVGNSNDWNRLLSKGIRHSMSRKGNCWDKAAVESFFSRLKVESLIVPRYNGHQSQSDEVSNARIYSAKKGLRLFKRIFSQIGSVALDLWRQIQEVATTLDIDPFLLPR